MVTVSFDPTLIAKPEESMRAKRQTRGQARRAAECPRNLFAPDPNDPKYLAEQKEAKEKAEREQKDYEKKIADGKKRGQELTDRFARLVLRDSGRQLPLDQPRPRRSGQAQESRAGELRARRRSCLSPSLAADPAVSAAVGSAHRDRSHSSRYIGERDRTAQILGIVAALA